MHLYSGTVRSQNLVMTTLLTSGGVDTVYSRRVIQFDESLRHAYGHVRNCVITVLNFLGLFCKILVTMTRKNAVQTILGPFITAF